MVWPFTNNQQSQQNNAMNLGLANGAQTTQGGGQFTNAWGAGPPAQGQNPFLAGMGVPQQPMQPPSELELIAMLQQSATPVDAWVAGANFQQMLGVMSSLVTLNLVTFFRDARFVDDGNDGLKLDISSLPSDMQTMSAENVTAALSQLQAAANQAVVESVGRQQQILMMGQQSMLNSLMNNEGMMERAGQATGGLMRGMFNAATGMR